MKTLEAHQTIPFGLSRVVLTADENKAQHRPTAIVYLLFPLLLSHRTTYHIALDEKVTGLHWLMIRIDFLRYEFGGLGVAIRSQWRATRRTFWRAEDEQRRAYKWTPLVRNAR